MILINESHALFDTTGMFFKEFPSDYRQIRYFTLLIIQKAPPEIKEINLLEQQISEIIKNAVKHGNKSDINKTIRVWYSFSVSHAHLVVEDEGEGFQAVKEWNEFNSKRLQCLHAQNYEELEKYVAFRTENSDEFDGGNALFAAVEFWDEGVVFNDKRNRVAVKKTYATKKYGISLDEL